MFGLESGPLNVGLSLFALGLVCLDLALVYWVFRDSRHRVDDALLVACAVIAALIFPFVGTLIYAIVRPPEFLEDAYEREVSIQANEALVKTLGELARSNRELSAQVGRLEQLIVVRRKATQGGAREATGPGSVPPPRR
ncbi:MAG: hypothetical protein Q7T55_09835 [Solirubrobacteraceae bacterium]|nr:hypothetical protein [Solirubrobacteraceae bacterium]